METVSMSYEELDRVRVIERAIEKRLSQREAATILGLSTRQVRRLRQARWKRIERRILYRDIVPMWHAQLDAELREERRAEREARRRCW